MTNATTNAQVTGFSQISDEEVLSIEQTFGAHHYGRLQVVVRKTEGCWLTDVNGKKYFDCLAA